VNVERVLVIAILVVLLVWMLSYLFGNPVR
jgi:hypothetical protein